MVCFPTAVVARIPARRRLCSSTPNGQFSLWPTRLGEDSTGLRLGHEDSLEVVESWCHVIQIATGGWFGSLHHLAAILCRRFAMPEPNQHEKQGLESQGFHFHLPWRRPRRNAIFLRPHPSARADRQSPKECHLRDADSSLSLHRNQRYTMTPFCSSLSSYVSLPSLVLDRILCLSKRSVELAMLNCSNAHSMSISPRFPSDRCPRVARPESVVAGETNSICGALGRLADSRTVQLPQTLTPQKRLNETEVRALGGIPAHPTVHEGVVHHLEA